MSSTRVELRLPQHERDLIDRAAAYHMQTVSAFLRQAAVEAAQKVIKSHEAITLGAEELARFQEALDHPPAPNVALREAASAWLKETARQQFS